VRIRAVDVVKKNRSNGTFYACCDLAVFKDKAEADKVGDDGAPNGQMLVSPQVDRVKVRNLDLESNGLVQLYDKLKTDLTAAGITWAEEA
jgi:hypothetical protein